MQEVDDLQCAGGETEWREERKEKHGKAKATKNTQLSGAGRLCQFLTQRFTTLLYEVRCLQLSEDHTPLMENQDCCNIQNGSDHVFTLARVSLVPSTKQLLRGDNRQQMSPLAQIEILDLAKLKLRSD